MLDKRDCVKKKESQKREKNEKFENLKFQVKMEAFRDRVRQWVELHFPQFQQRVQNFTFLDKSKIAVSFI